MSSVKFTCPCGTAICKSSINSHLSSRKHHLIMSNRNCPIREKKRAILTEKLAELYDMKDDFTSAEYLAKNNWLMNEFKRDYDVIMDDPSFSNYMYWKTLKIFTYPRFYGDRYENPYRDNLKIIHVHVYLNLVDNSLLFQDV